MLYLLRTIIRKLPGTVIKAVPFPNPKTTSGFEARNKVGQICCDNGFKSALVVTDSTIHSLGLHEKIISSLEERSVNYKIFSNIKTEPNLNMIDEGRDALKDFNADAIIALGGGTVLDACKIIAAGGRLKNRKTKSLLRKFLFVKNKTLPIIAIPTTSGTGAEITVGSVVTNKKGKKVSTVVVGLDVREVILDSELTIKTPKNITCACAIDALSHGLEGVVASVRSSDEDLNKSMECVKLIIDNLPKLIENMEDVEARQNMCLAANYGGNAINKQLAGYVHAFAHSIGAKYHIPHGNAIALSIIPVMNIQKEKCLSRLSELSKYCGLSNNQEDELTAANKILDKISNLIEQCGFVSYKNIILKEDYKEIANAVSYDSINYSAPVVLNNKQIYQVLDEININ